MKSTDVGTHGVGALVVFSRKNLSLMFSSVGEIMRELSGPTGAHTSMKPSNEPLRKRYYQKSKVQDSVIWRQ